MSDTAKNQNSSNTKLLSGWVFAVTIILSLGMLPSFQAISDQLASSHPGIQKLLGPLNFLKVFWPLTFGFIWLNRKKIPSLSKKAFLAVFLLGSLATLIAATPCSFPSMFFREWAVISLGCLSAVALVLLPAKNARIVVVVWAVILFSGVAINYFAPAWTNAIFRHLFDYHYAVPEIPRSAKRLSGYYDIASLGKLMAWFPWIFGIFFIPPTSDNKRKTMSWLIFALVLVLCAVIAPMTTQRGPVLGLFVGVGLACMHQVLQSKNYRLLKWVPIALILTGILGWAVIPRETIQARFFAYFGASSSSQKDINESRVSSDQRVRIWKLAVQHIEEHPFGRPCHDPREYEAAGIEEMSHAHNLFLEQTVSRGWIWGVVHLGLWLLALVFAWRDPSIVGSLMVGGVGTTIGLGMVDYPWFVLNHALILGTFLFYYWVKPARKANDRARLV